MKKQGCVYPLLRACLLLLGTGLLSGCLSNWLTGAKLVYDRHNVYKKLSDFQLNAQASHALFHDQLFKRRDCSIDLAVFNGDILLAGHVATRTLQKQARQRVEELTGYRRLFMQIKVSDQPNNNVEDSWITAKIRSRIFADSEIDPNAFKVITADGIVYLMGDVRPQQAAKVIAIARSSERVFRVVKLLKYYNLSSSATSDD